MAPPTPTAPIDRGGAWAAPPDPDGSRRAVDDRLERATSLVLRIAVALTAVFVVVPAIGVAAAMVLLATQEQWHGGEGVVTADARGAFLSVALVALGFAAMCGVILRWALRRRRIALIAVGLGGLGCLYSGVRGILEATGVDTLVAAYAGGVAATGATLALAAVLGTAAWLRARPPAPPGSPVRPGPA